MRKLTAWNQKNPLYPTSKRVGEVEHLENTAEEEQEVAFDVASFSIMGPVEVMLLANEEDAYAILYSNGTMVFQRGDTPDPSMER